MRILTGDDNGLIKCTQVSAREENKQAFRYGMQKEDHGIDHIRWSLADNE
jgi:hypothetical protein